jgi:DNA mismatch repair protein MutL
MADWFRSAAPIQPGSPADPGPQTYDPITPPSHDDPIAAWRALYGMPPHHGGMPSAAATPEPQSTLPQATFHPETPADRHAPPGAHSGLAAAASSPRAIQMHNLYLVAETDDGIVIVDQHALHERILYENLRARFNRGPLESQRLLLPEPVSVSAGQRAALEEHTDLLSRIGVEVTEFDSDSIAVQSVPVVLKNADAPSFVHDLLDYLAQQSGKTDPDAVIDRALSMMACKAAVKAGDPLAPEEIQALFAQRALVDKPGSCPHGRPTMLRLTKAELNRQFHRT